MCELLIATSCITVLLALLLPAVICARESARRATCCSQLHELSIAVQHFHDRKGQFPASWQAVRSDPSFICGWATEILPEIGEAAIDETLRNSDAIRRLSTRSLPLLLCPSDITEPTFELWPDTEEEEEEGTATAQALAPSDEQHRLRSRILPTANYVGVYGTTEADEQLPNDEYPEIPPSDGSIVHDRRVRMADLERGTSKTILIGERTMATVPSTWLGVELDGEDAQCRLVGSAMIKPNCMECDECDFSSRHAGGVNFAWADGHVEMINDEVETAVYRTYAQRFAR